jgi:hypothetical protein
MSYKIKVLSLKRRNDRRELFDSRFSDFQYEYFYGLDGKNYTLSEYDTNWIDGNIYAHYKIHIPSLVCANKSHILMLKQCISDNIPYIIFEDDTEIIKPIDFKFEDIVKKDLDVFWLMPKQSSILCYMVWPTGAKKLIKCVDKKGGLIKGLDDMWHIIKDTGYLREESLSDEYFTQRMGAPDSDITSLLDYQISKELL